MPWFWLRSAARWSHPCGGDRGTATDVWQGFGDESQCGRGATPRLGSTGCFRPEASILASRPEIDPALIGQPHEVHEHVGHLLRQSRVQRLLMRKVASGIRRQPLQQLGQLPHLTDERQHHGLGVLELIPVTFGDEGARSVPDLDQVRHTGEYAAPPRLGGRAGLESQL